jgi:hypothetical protein
MEMMKKKVHHIEKNHNAAEKFLYGNMEMGCE